MNIMVIDVKNKKKLKVKMYWERIRKTRENRKKR
jgi:hypothetical protein